MLDQRAPIEEPMRHAQDAGAEIVFEAREIHVHEFVSPDGVSDEPTRTADYGFVPRMEEALGAVAGRCRGILGYR
ncbi:MAG: hypothetical protein M3Y38_05840 [Actinomycetota bacterium]|nr:hypothetical protein [Actinomycetota bacterium]